MAIHSPLDEPTPEQLFLEHLPFIKRAAEHACRRCHLGPEDTEDFISIVSIKLIENDYEVIRKFRGEKGGTLKTYLGVVVNNAMLDYRNHLWGKWRPSAEAKRLGSLAVQIERLLRDGYTFDEVCEILRTNYRVDKTWQEFEELRARLRTPSPRRPEGEEAGAEVSDPGEGPEKDLLGKEREARHQRALEAQRHVLETLSPEDRLILKMESEGIKISTIARTLGVEQKPLYRRIDRLRKTLRESLEREGIDPADLYL